MIKTLGLTCSKNRKKMASGGQAHDSDASVAWSNYSEPSKKDLGEGYSYIITGPKSASLYKNGKHVDTKHPSDVSRRMAEHKKGMDLDKEVDCSCVCHKSSDEGGWNSEECCPDCGASLTSNFVD